MFSFILLFIIGFFIVYCYYMNNNGYYIRKEYKKTYLLNLRNNTCYYVEKNKFEDYDCRECLEFMDSRNKKISEYTYKKLLKNKICNCKVGDGFNIHSTHSYDPILEYNTLNKKYKLELDNDVFDDSIYASVLDVNTNEFKFLIRIEGVRYKKACFACGTCLDEHKTMIDDIDRKIKEREDFIKNKEWKDKMVEDICQK